MIILYGSNSGGLPCLAGFPTLQGNSRSTGGGRGSCPVSPALLQHTLCTWAAALPQGIVPLVAGLLAALALATVQGRRLATAHTAILHRPRSPAAPAAVQHSTALHSMAYLAWGLLGCIVPLVLVAWAPTQFTTAPLALRHASCHPASNQPTPSYHAAAVQPTWAQLVGEVMLFSASVFNSVSFCYFLPNTLLLDQIIISTLRARASLICLKKTLCRLLPSTTTLLSSFGKHPDNTFVVFARSFCWRPLLCWQHRGRSWCRGGCAGWLGVC